MSRRVKGRTVMPWIRENDGLALDGNPHYDKERIQHLIEQLRHARNKPEKVCRMLEELIASRKASRGLIWRLSKWCHWNDSSAEIAQEIAGGLFHNLVCRRLLDQRDKPIPDKASAEADYQAWLGQIIEAGRSS